SAQTDVSIATPLSGYHRLACGARTRDNPARPGHIDAYPCDPFSAPERVHRTATWRSVDSVGAHQADWTARSPCGDGDPWRHIDVLGSPRSGASRTRGRDMAGSNPCWLARPFGGICCWGSGFFLSVFPTSV